MTKLSDDIDQMNVQLRSMLTQTIVDACKKVDQSFIYSFEQKKKKNYHFKK